MKAMEKAKMVKFKEGLKAKASKPSATLSAKQMQMPMGETAMRSELGGVVVSNQKVFVRCNAHHGRE